MVAQLWTHAAFYRHFARARSPCRKGQAVAVQCPEMARSAGLPQQPEPPRPCRKIPPVRFWRCRCLEMLRSAAHVSLQEIMPYHFMEPSRRFGCSPGVAPTLVGTLAPPDPFLKPFRSWRTVEQACYNFRAKKGIDQSVAVRMR